MMKYTKAEHEEWLNELEVPSDDHPENNGRVPWSMVNRYGSWMRKHDPIAFQVSYQERELQLRS